MHFQGREVVSKGTKVSSRTLLMASFAILLVFYTHPTDAAGVSAQIAGLDFELNQLLTAGRLILIFLLVGHLISWWGDFISLSDWNDSERSLPTSLGAGAPLSSKIDRALDRLESSIKNVERHNREDPDLGKQFLRREDVEACADEMRQLRKGVVRLSKHSLWVLFGWYLTVPVVFFLAATVRPDVVAMLPGAHQEKDRPGKCYNDGTVAIRCAELEKSK